MTTDNVKAATADVTMESESAAQPTYTGIAPCHDSTSNSASEPMGMLATNTGNTMLEWGIAYARLGLAVVPVAPGDKRPILKDWPNAATTETDAISSWFISDHPGGNIALATGKKSGNVIAIDVDMKPDKGIDGMRAVTAWQEKHGLWPKTPTSITGSGGRHYLFRVPEPMGNSVNADLGVDIRGDGGCIVLPPSIHPNGNAYMWEVSPGECPIADANESVLGFIRYVQNNAKAGSHVASGEPWERRERVPEGGRNNEIYRACSHWRRRGYSKTEMEKEALAYNETAFDPPMDMKEIKAIVSRVYEEYRSERHAVRPAGLADFDPSPEIVNDKELSRLFARTYKECLCYVKDEGKFFFFDGKCWMLDVDGVEAQLLCKEFVDLLMGRKDDIADDQERTRYMKSLSTYEKQNSRERLIKDSKAELAVDAACFDTDPMLFNAQNGTIDLRTGELRQHDASDMITKCAPVSYAKGAKSELWERIQAEVFEGDMETMCAFQVALGRMLICDTSEECFYIAGFTPRSGKSLVFGAITRLLGTGKDGYAYVVPSETFEQSRNKLPGRAREDLTDLNKARLIISNEPRKGMQLDCALIKALTGRDMITARKLWKGNDTFICIGTIFIVTNHFPQILDETIHESGRMLVLPFNRAVPSDQQDKTLKDRLRKPEEMAGILNWLLDGVRMCLEGTKANPSGAMDTAYAAVIEASDHVGSFIKEVLVKDSSSRLRGADVHKAYQRWCAPRGLDSMKPIEFYDRLKRHSIEVKRTSSDRNSVVGYAFAPGYGNV